MRPDSAVRIVTRRHVEATAEGEIPLAVTGPGGCAGTLVLRSERPIGSRWLERGRPRLTLARGQFTLEADGRAEVILRLAPAHLALVRRMGAIRAVAHVVTTGGHAAAGVTVHGQPRRKAAGRCAAARAAVTGVLTLIVCTPAALASWSAPQTLSSREATGTPALGIDVHGAALATWARQFGRGWRLASRPAGADAFGLQRAAPYLGDEVVDGALPAPLVYGDRRALALEQHKGRSTCGGLATRYALAARSGPGSPAPATSPPSSRTSSRRRSRSPATDTESRSPPGSSTRATRAAAASGPAARCSRRPSTGREPASAARHAASRRRVPDRRGGRRRARRHARGHPPQGRPRDALARDLGSLERAARAHDRRPARRRAARRDRPRRRRLAAVVERAQRGPHGEQRGPPGRARRASARCASWSAASLTGNQAARQPRPLAPAHRDARSRRTGATAAWTSSDGVHLRVMVALARGDAPLDLLAVADARRRGFRAG